MPKFLEKKLKKKYGKDSSVPYKIMNSIGAMKGNKETAKGKSMQSKHDSDYSPSIKGLGGQGQNQGQNQPHQMKKKKKKSFAEAVNE